MISPTQHDMLERMAGGERLSYSTTVGSSGLWWEGTDKRASIPAFMALRARVFVRIVYDNPCGEGLYAISFLGQQYLEDLK